MSTARRSRPTQTPGAKPWEAESQAEREARNKAAEERAREARWRHPGRARVVDPVHGGVIVPCGSKLAAIMCAAEVWGVSWTELHNPEVWAVDMAPPRDKEVKE